MSLQDKIWSFITDDHGVPLALSRDERGQIATIIAVVTVGIVAMIGILIYSQVDASLAQPDNAALQDARDNVTEGFGDSMQLIPVVLLVMVASLVISVVQQFG